MSQMVKGVAKMHKTNSFDIAQKVGVAQSTVSRALRGEKCVSEATRQRIITAARELNYVMDRNASNMRLRTTATIALVVIYREDESVASISAFHHLLIGRIAEAAAERGYNILISFQNEADNLYGHYQDSRMADGLIVIGTTLNQPAWAYFGGLAAEGRAIASWGGRDDGAAWLMCDNLGGAALATDHLVARGCKRIAFIGPTTPEQRQFYERHTGFLTAMSRHGLTPVTVADVHAANRDQDGYDSVADLLQRDVAFDGLFAASDAIAIGALRALHDHGRRVPQEVAVVGFDNIPAAKSYTPSLSTIEPDYLQAGKLLVQNVCDQIAGTQTSIDPVVTRVPVRLIVRESSK